MKKNNVYQWPRLLRTVVALLLVMSMVLCGCAQTGDGDGEGEKEESKQNAIFGDGDGKLEAQDAVDSLTNIYGALLGAAGGNQSDASGYEMDLVVTLGDTLLGQLRDAMEQAELDSDLSWFEDIGLHMEANYATDLVQMAVTAQLNGKKLVSAEVILDMLGGMGYLSMPELNSQVIGSQIDMSQMQGSMMNSAAMLEEYAALAKDLPTDKELNGVLTRYLNVLLENLNKATTGETQLSTGGITQKVTTTTYSFTIHNVLDIATKVLTTAKTDAELEKVLDAFSKVINEQGAKQAADSGYTWTNVDLHAQLMEAIDPALEDIQDNKQNQEDMEFARLVIYTDGDDQVGGMVQVNNGYALVDYISLYSLKDGKNTALFMNVMGAVQLTGTGKQSGGDVSGEYTLSSNGQALVYLELEDFDTKALKKGELKGKLRLSFGDMLLDNMGNNMFLSEDTVIELVLDLGGKKAEIECNLYVDELLMVGISMSSKITSGGKIKVPTDYVDGSNSNAMAEWAENMDFSGVLNNLQSAGVPGKLVEILENALKNAMPPQGDYNEPVSTYPAYGY